MTTTLDIAFKARSHIITQSSANQTALLNPQTGEIFGLTGASLRIWEVMQRHSNMLDVRDQIMEEFGVDEDALTRDLLGFISQLQESEIIDLEGPVA